MKTSQIEIGRMKPNPKNRPINMASQHMIDLTASIKEHGVLQPLISDSDLNVIAGSSRLAAAGAAGLKTVPVVVIDREMSDTEKRLIQLTENIQRKDLSDQQIFVSLHELLSINPAVQQQDLAKNLGKSAAYVSKHLSPARATEEVREAFMAAKLTALQVSEIVKLPADQQNGRMHHLLSGTAPKPQRKAAAAKQERVSLPIPGYAVSISGPSLDLEAVIETLGALVSAAKAAQKDNLELSTFSAVLANKAGVTRA